MSSEVLTIGHLAKSVNVNVETIRYYQRVGLIKEPPKPAEGYRLYPVSWSTDSFGSPSGP